MVGSGTCVIGFLGNVIWATGIQAFWRKMELGRRRKGKKDTSKAFLLYGPEYVSIDTRICSVMGLICRTARFLMYPQVLTSLVWTRALRFPAQKPLEGSVSPLQQLGLLSPALPAVAWNSQRYEAFCSDIRVLFHLCLEATRTTTLHQSRVLQPSLPLLYLAPRSFSSDATDTPCVFCFPPFTRCLCRLLLNGYHK